MSAIASILEPLRRRVFAAAPTPDAVLLQRYATTRDPEAFCDLVERHGPLVLGVARRIAGDADADDIFQATFLMLARKPGMIRRPDALAVWLHHTAYRLALNARRAEERRRIAELRRPVPQGRNPLDELSARELLAILDSEIERLPEKDRLPLILCCLEGFSLDEAASRLGVTPGAVKGRLERSRLRLGRALAKRGFLLPTILAPGLLLTPYAVARPLIESTIAVCLGSAAVPDAVAALIIATPRPRLWIALLIGLMGIGVGWIAVAKSPAPQPPPPANPAPVPRVDLHGDPLPEAAVARLGTERLRAADSSLGLSSDGETIITVSKALVVREWDAADGRLKSVRRLANQVTHFHFLSPDGKWLMFRSAGAPDHDKLVVWDVAAGRRVYSRSLPSHWNVKAASFDADGRGAVILLELQDAISVYRVDFQTDGWRELFQPFRLPFTVGEHLEVSPDRRTVVVSDYHHTLVCWDLVAGKERWQLSKAGALFAFSPDSRTLLIDPPAKDAKTFELRDVATGHALPSDRLPPRSWASLEQRDGALDFAFRFTPSGRELVLHQPGQGLVLWDLTEGAKRLALPAGFAPNRRSAITSDGRTLITLGKTLQRWNLTTGKPQYPDGEAWGHTGLIDRIEFSPNGRQVLSVAMDGTARVWDVAAARSRSWRGHGAARVNAGAFLPDGRHVVTIGDDGFLRLWEMDSEKELRSHSYHDPKVDRYTPHARHLFIAPDGKTAIAFSQTELKYRVTRWDVETGESLDSKLVDWMIPSPDGKLGYSYTNQKESQARLTDIDSGSVARILKCAPPPGGADGAARETLTFSRDGRLLAALVFRWPRPGPTTYFVYVWETAGGSPLLAIPTTDLQLCEMPSGAKQAFPLAFSRDARLLAFADPDALRVWDLAARREVWRKSDAIRSVTSLAFAPDGRTLAAGYDDTTILIWNLPQPEKRTPFADDDRELVWADLASPEPTKGHAAMWRLIDDPKTAVPLLRERLLPAPVAAETIRPLVKDLGDENFKTREAAERRLREFGKAAQTELQAALRTEQRPEAKRRLQSLLAAFEGDDHRRRVARALAVLERIDSPDARRLRERVNAASP